MNFYSATISNLRFMDSCNMLKGSLSSLANQHILNKGDVSLVKSSLSDYSNEAQDLLASSGKQFFPYEYLDNVDKLHETQLPPRECFYSSLTDSSITEEDYQHAQLVWEKTGCQTLEDYVKLYLILDVSFLSEIYLNWRNVLLQEFKLDCLYFLTLASYAIEAMYYRCKISLDSLYDPNLYHMITRNIRGGFCSVGQRHVIANNKDTNPNFDAGTMKSNYLLYVDFNSLYPTVMSQFKLPMGDFAELSESELIEFQKQDLVQIDTIGDIGYYIYCDIAPIRKEVIDKTDSYPLILSQKNIQDEDISDYTRNLLDERDIKLGNNNSKLVAHHCGVENYLIALPLLQYLVKTGAEVSKIHTVIKFKQGFFLKEFIDQNIKKRAEATNPFIKNALKLINNAVYGRTLLNQLNYACEAKLCHDENSTTLLKSFSKPTFRNVDVINSDRFLVTYNKANVKVSSPIYVGFSILEHAKLYMYRFWYSTIVHTYGKKASFVYSDTDSFIINIESPDLIQEINGPLAPHLDLSNFPSHHPLYSSKCKGQLGKLKIETAPYFMKEFVALKPKAYSYTTTEHDNLSCNTLKGVPKHIKQNNLNIEAYKSCLYNNVQKYENIFNLRFCNSDMSLIKMNKLVLSSIEDKRFYFNNLKSVGYGHYKIRECVEKRTREDDHGDDPPTKRVYTDGMFFFTFLL